MGHHRACTLELQRIPLCRLDSPSNAMNVKPLFPCQGRYKTSGLLSRRRMLVESAGGFGGLALASLLKPEGVLASESKAALSPKRNRSSFST